MTTIKKILCAVDLTKASRNAFDGALSIARVSQARLYMLHAVPANYSFSWRQSERLEFLTSCGHVPSAKVFWCGFWLGSSASGVLVVAQSVPVQF